MASSPCTSVSHRYVLMDESTGEVKREVPVRTVQLYPDMAHDERIGMWDEWNVGAQSQ